MSIESQVDPVVKPKKLTVGNQLITRRGGYPGIVDESGLEFEISSLKETTLQITGEIANRAFIVGQRDPQFMKSWKLFTDDLIEGCDVSSKMVNEVNTKLHCGGLAQSEFELGLCLSLGAYMFIRDTLGKLESLAEQAGFGEEIKNWAHSIYLTDAFIPKFQIQGISLGDFAKSKIIERSSPVPYQTFLVEAHMADRLQTCHKYVEDNQILWGYKSPNLITTFALEVNQTVKSLLHMSNDPASLQSYAASSSGINRKVAENALSIVMGIQTLRTCIAKNLFNPKSPYFTDLKHQFTNFLGQDIDTQIDFLYAIGLNNKESVYRFYREAEARVRKGEEVDFFTKLEDGIVHLIEELPEGHIIPTREDVVSFFQPSEGLAKTSKVDLNALAKVVNQIFSRSSTRNYNLDPRTITWGGLVPPKEVLLTFDKNRPTICSYHLTYSNAEGELLNVSVWFDLKKGQFQWSLLESPDDPLMESVCQACALVLPSMLDGVQIQVREQERIKALKSCTPIEGGGVKFKNNDRDLICSERETALVSVPPQKDSRKKSFQISQEPKQVRAIQNPPYEKPVIRNNIIVPEGEESWADMVRHLSGPDRSIILSGIGEYNDRGVGRFQRLKGDRSRYSLRVNGTTPGGMRVILVEVEPAGLTRRFQIIDIRYRKDSYRDIG